MRELGLNYAVGDSGLDPLRLMLGMIWSFAAFTRLRPETKEDPYIISHRTTRIRSFSKSALYGVSESWDCASGFSPSQPNYLNVGYYNGETLSLWRSIS